MKYKRIDTRMLGINSIVRVCPNCLLGAVVIKAMYKDGQWIALCERCDYRETGKVKVINPTRFDSPRKPSKEKWWAIIAYNGTQLLARQVASYTTKSRASNFAKDLIGKTYKGKLVTTVVLEGPFKSMMAASNVEVVMPFPV